MLRKAQVSTESINGSRRRVLGMAGGLGLAMSGVRAQACTPRVVTHGGLGLDVPCPEPRVRLRVVGARARLGFMVYQNSNVLDLVHGDYINPDAAIARAKALGAEVGIPVAIGVAFGLGALVSGGSAIINGERDLSSIIWQSYMGGISGLYGALTVLPGVGIGYRVFHGAMSVTTGYLPSIVNRSNPGLQGVGGSISPGGFSAPQLSQFESQFGQTPDVDALYQFDFSGVGSGGSWFGGGGGGGGWLVEADVM